MAYRYGIPAMAAAVAAACAAPAAMESEPRTEAAQGHAVARAECARCHSVERVGTSPLAGAPPLRTVLARYNAATLEADLIEGMRVGHAEMPRFSFDPLTAGALIAYLESIQE